MDRLIALSLLGTTLSVSNNITPLLAIFQRAKNKQLDQLPKKYILINHFCQLFWICYSIRVRLFGLILVNSMTFILSLINNLVLNYYSNNLGFFLLTYSFLASLISFSCFFMISIQFNGLICVFLGVSSTMSIFESIYKVVKTQDYRFIDLKIATSMFGTGSVWFSYSVLAKENNSFYTSGFTTFMGILMILTHMSYRLYFSYGRKLKDDKMKKFFRTSIIIV